MANYVKFVRGFTETFKKLTTKDADTLYFIYDNESSTSGHLYLGDKEIVCDNGPHSGVSYLNDLLDVALPENIGELIDGQVLTYDAMTNTWVARDPSTVATVLFDENQFTKNENGEWSLLDFANAPSGARLTKGANGKLIWDLPSGATEEDLAEQIEALNTKFNDYDTSAQVDTKISEALAAANHLSYKAVDTIGDIDLTAMDVDQYIYLVKNGEVYDEYMVVDGKLEKVGDWNVDLNEYAKKTEVQTIDTKVVDLTAQLNSAKTDIETLKNTSSQVIDLATQLNQMNAKVQENTTTIITHTTQIEELQNLLNNKADAEDFEELKASMSWTNLSND